MLWHQYCLLHCNVNNHRTNHWSDSALIERTTTTTICIPTSWSIQHYHFRVIATKSWKSDVCNLVSTSHGLHPSIVWIVATYGFKTVVMQHQNWPIWNVLHGTHLTGQSCGKTQSVLETLDGYCKQKLFSSNSAPFQVSSVQTNEERTEKDEVVATLLIEREM